LKIGNLEIERGVLLAPMEGVTDLPFRLLCRRMGADIVYTEFIASEALIRDSVKSFNKMSIHPDEHPAAVQIFGGNTESMTLSAQIVEQSGADILDLNYGCWVPKVVKGNAGAALLKEPEKMAEITREVVKKSKLPVTVKTRLGWDKNDISILGAAKMLEDSGIQALTVHCRTRDMGMQGMADWSWINRLKEILSIPVILNGDIKNYLDAELAFAQTGCDAIMIGRAAVGNPFIFRQIKQYFSEGVPPAEPTAEEKIGCCLEHLRMMIDFKGIPRGLREFRKHYSGYLKGLYNSHPVRQEVVVMDSFDEICDRLMKYNEYLTQHEKI